MDFWRDIVGQDAAVRRLNAAADPAGSDELSHAWLITGPPGSGRSNLAFLFAAALIARTEDERPEVLAQVRSRTHPDLGVLSTEKVLIEIKAAREIATTAHYSPSVGRYRVIVIEDADRMPERTSNVLLKALEEPPERTIWVLCAPSEADLIPTIRSRVRSLRLVTPAVDDVAALLVNRDGLDAAEAERAARLAQSHIGMARRLAADPNALARRQRTIELVLGARGLGGAMRVAAELAELAGEDAKAITAERDAREREEALRNLGVAPGQAVPPALRSQIKTLEENQKRRATRSLRDGIDRILTDLLSLFRDVLVTQLGASDDLVNLEFAGPIRARADAGTPEGTLATIDALGTARERIARNVTPGLALEAFLARAALESSEDR